MHKTGQACRRFVTWLVERGLLDRGSPCTVSYSITKADNAGLDPKAVKPDLIWNLDMVCSQLLDSPTRMAPSA